MKERRETLNKLYDALVLELIKAVQGGDATAATLQCARQLLNDAGIGADSENPDGPTSELLEALRKFDSEEAAVN